jgi:ubiquinone/menaquinone biosynthesis C-methylase UbiE
LTQYPADTPDLGLLGGLSDHKGVEKQALRDYRQIYSRDWRKYLSQEIHPAESAYLESRREAWATTRLLDLGVGTGRTTWTFAPLVEHYTAIDVVPEMVAHCLETFAPHPQREFLVGDAQDLSRFPANHFDAVLFSFNGIDHLSPAARKRCLEEIHRVLKSGGSFFFSSHSLTVFPHTPSDAGLRGRNPFRWLGQWRQNRAVQERYRRLNADVASAEVQQRGWAILSDGSHEGEMEIYYCYPWAQIEHLKAVGFEVETLLTNLGKPIPDPKTPTPSWWNYYLCTKP